MELIEDNVSSSRVVHGKWLFFQWNTPDGGNKFSVYRDLKKAEKLIFKKKLKGWIIASDKEYVKMHSILRRLGGQLYDEDADSFYFAKEITNERQKT